MRGRSNEGGKEGGREEGGHRAVVWSLSGRRGCRSDPDKAFVLRGWEG